MTDQEKARLLHKRRKMIARCFNPTNKDYKWYGAKGIKVCSEWVNDKSAFIEWADRMGYSLGDTIERFDNNKDYCPDNCCFIPMSQQARNTSRNVYVEYKGRVLIASDVARLEKVSPEAIRKRIKHGWYRVVDKPKVEATPTPAH
jgi:hypothetical protein